MAKRPGRRDYSNTTQSLPDTVFGPSSPTAGWPSPLTEFEDRRLWHPEGPYAPAQTFWGPASVEVGNRPRRSQFNWRSWLTHFPSQTRGPIGFKAPAETLICVRRKTRKQVLFAKRKTGRGRKRRRPRRSWMSQFRC